MIADQKEVAEVAMDIFRQRHFKAALDFAAVARRGEIGAPRVAASNWNHWGEQGRKI